MSNQVSLDNQQEFFREFLDAAPDAVVVVDESGTIVLVNSQTECLFGYKREELIGSTLDILIPRRFHESHRKHVHAYTGNPHVRRMGSQSELLARRSDDSEFRVDIAISPLQFDGRRLYIAAIRDISDRVQAEQALQRAKEMAESASKAKSAFLANMSHEIRSPMGAIIGMTELLLDTPLNSEQQQWLKIVQASSESLLSLINDILDYSRIEHDRFELETLEFSLSDCIGVTLKAMEVQAIAKGLALRSVIQPDLPGRVIGDPMRFRQILINLVGNAIKFTVQGEIIVRAHVASRAKDEIVLDLQVADTGIGIAPENRDHIFDAFEQVDPSFARKFGGTGLGLAITQKMLGLMGGSIKFESEVGCGTTFDVTIPFRVLSDGDSIESAGRRSQVDCGIAEPRKRTVRAHGLRVLVAEDQAYNQTLMKALLEKQGHQITLAPDGRTAVELFQSRPFDIVLMDVRMPEMDGLSATRRIREHESLTGVHTPIVAMTAEAMKGDADVCLEAGMDAYMSKPIRAVELFEKIDALVASGIEGDEPSNASSNTAWGTKLDKGPDVPEKMKTSPVATLAKEPAAEAFDWSLALEYVAGNRKLLARMVDAFVNEYPSLADKLQRAVDDGDTKSLHLLAHGMKGAMRSFGATVAESHAEQLEQLAYAATLDGVDELAMILKEEIDNLIPEFLTFVQPSRLGTTASTERTN